jgi:hypothetical protein
VRSIRSLFSPFARRQDREITIADSHALESR